jgi:hypothetical protein
VLYCRGDTSRSMCVLFDVAMSWSGIDLVGSPGGVCNSTSKGAGWMGSVRACHSCVCFGCEVFENGSVHYAKSR